MQCKWNISEQNLHDRENKTCEGEILRQTTNPSGDCYSILQTELVENIYDLWWFELYFTSILDINVYIFMPKNAFNLINNK